MGWYHSHFSKVDAATALDIEAMFLEMNESAVKKPTLRRMSQYYSRLYYKTRIKHKFDQEWALEIAKSELNQTPLPSKLKFRNALTDRIYNAEPILFREQLTRQRDEEHAIALQEYEKTLSEEKKEPNCALSYHK